MKGVIGVGNPFKGDDGIGVKLIEETRESFASEGVQIFEVGSDTFEILHILKDLEAAIIVDAVRFGGEPGDYRFFTSDDVESLKGSETAHATNIIEVLNLSDKLDESPERVLIMGVQPKDTNLGEEFSPPVKKRIPELVEILQEKIESFFSL